MRIDVDKFLFVGPAKCRSAFLERAQRAGLIEFTSSGEKKERGQTRAGDLEQLMSALKIVQRAAVRRSEPAVDMGAPRALDATRGSEILALAGQVVKWQGEIERLEGQILSLKKAERLAEPFGAFSLVTLRQLANECRRELQFYTCARARLPAKLPEEVLEISCASGQWFGMSLAKAPLTVEGLKVVELQFSHSEVRANLCELEAAKRSAQRAVMSAIHSVSALQSALIDLVDERALQSADAHIAPLLSDQLFAAQGWVVKSARPQLAAILGDAISAFSIAPDAGEVVPTQLVNRGAARIGQDLTEIYDTPASTDSDPSGWVLWSFVCFFALIVGDGGYGILFLLGTWWAGRRIATQPTSSTASRMLRLARLLSCACIAWGLLSSSFFALPIPVQSPLRGISLVTKLAEAKAQYHFARRDAIYAEWTRRIPEMAPLQRGAEILLRAEAKVGGVIKNKMLSQFSDQIALELSLIIGIAHICLSLGRYARRNWSQLGWILFLIGSYAYVPKIFQAATLLNVLGNVSPELAHQVGEMLMIGGFSAAIALAFFQRGAWGILEATTLIQIGADVLSYLRIYALGLSGAILSSTINEGAAAIGGPLALLVLISGHGVNLLLGLMGGVIHGLRLNFLEWYHYSFEGGGRMLKPLCLMKRAAELPQESAYEF